MMFVPRWPHLRTGLLLLWLVPGVAAAQESNRDSRNLTAERIVVTLAANPDGSVDVREEMVVRFGDDRESRFERQIERTQNDGIADVAAEIDGVPAEPGREPGQVQVTSGRSVRVRWRFAPVSNTTRTFTLRYRLVNAVAPRGGRALFRWPALSSRRGYPVDHASVSFEAPPGRVFYAGTGVAEAGWVVGREGEGFVARKDGLGRREGGTFVAEFSADGLHLAEPQWLFDQQRAATLMPAFLSGGVFILVVGLGILWIVGFQHPSARVRVREADAHEVALPTALAVTLAARRYPGHQDLPLGTLADLVRRGVLRPTSTDAATLSFASNEQNARLQSHEALVVAHVERADGDHPSFERLRKQLVDLAGPYRTAVLEDLVAAGHADIDRMAVAAGLVRGGLATLALGAVSLAAVLYWMSRFGPWPLAVPVSILVVGLLLVFRGAAFSILTPAGERASASWRRRLKRIWGMKPTARVADAHAVEELRRWLPEAVAAGQAETFAKKVDRHKTLVEVLGFTVQPFSKQPARQPSGSPSRVLGQ